MHDAESIYPVSELRASLDRSRIARLLVNLAKQDNADELYELAKKMAKRRSR